jgi:hypothetical protein
MYVIGVSVNLAALTILYRSERKTRNKKMVLMLRCLALNDLVALLGMLILMNLQIYLPLERVKSHEFCVVRVIWRQFGLSSGCVAVVMAIERWLALTHPFLYQKVSCVQTQRPLQQSTTQCSYKSKTAYAILTRAGAIFITDA